MAGTPRSPSAIASSADEVCSPVASSMSSSRGDGSTETSRAREMSMLVVLPIAETTTTRLSPSSTRLFIPAATCLIFSGVATDDPPYF